MAFKSAVLKDLAIFGRSCNDEGLVADIVTIFLDQSAIQVSNFCAAASIHDLEKQVYEIHRLKSNASVVGAIELRHLCEEIETMLFRFHSIASRYVDSLRSEVNLECKRLKIELEEHEKR